MIRLRQKIFLQYSENSNKNKKVLNYKRLLSKLRKTPFLHGDGKLTFYNFIYGQQVNWGRALNYKKQLKIFLRV